MMQPRMLCARSLLLVCLLLSISGLVTCVSAQTAATPVFNASFEELDGGTALPAGWLPWSDKSTCAYTLAVAHSGVASALVTDTDAAVSQGLRSRPIEVVPGRTYEARAWLQVVKAGSGFAIYLEYWCGTQRVKDVSVLSSQAPGWQELKVRAEVPPQATTATILIYSSSANTGSAYFDDVSLTPLP